MREPVQCFPIGHWTQDNLMSYITFFLSKPFLQEKTNETIASQEVTGKMKYNIAGTRGFQILNLKICTWTQLVSSQCAGHQSKHWLVHTYSLSTIIFTICIGFQPDGVLYICTTSLWKSQNEWS